MLFIVSICFLIILFRIKAIRLYKRDRLVLTIVGFDLTVFVLTIFQIVAFAAIIGHFIKAKINKKAKSTNLANTGMNPFVKRGLKFMINTTVEIMDLIAIYFELNVENIRFLDLKFNYKRNELLNIKLKSLSVPRVKITRNMGKLSVDVPVLKCAMDVYLYIVKLVEYFEPNIPKRFVIEQVRQEERETLSILAEMLENEYYLKLTVDSMKLKLDDIKISGNFTSTVELKENFHQTRGKILVETNHGQLISVEELEVSRNGGGSVHVGANIDCDLSLPSFLTVLNSIKPLLDTSKKTKTNVKVKKEQIMVLVSVPRLVFNLELPNDVKTTTVFDGLKITNDFENNFIINASIIRTEFPITTTGLFEPNSFYHNFLEIVDFKLLLVLETEDLPEQLKFSIDKATVRVPNGWPMANLVENGICLQKAIKQVIFEIFDKHGR